MRPERRPRCRNGGAGGSRPRTPPFWRKSDKSQGFGDRVPCRPFALRGIESILPIALRTVDPVTCYPVVELFVLADADWETDAEEAVHIEFVAGQRLVESVPRDRKSTRLNSSH